MSDAPKVCRYCDGTGKSSARGECGFCDNGKPLDTQGDWDRTWAPILNAMVGTSSKRRLPKRPGNERKR